VKLFPALLAAHMEEVGKTGWFAERAIDSFSKAYNSRTPVEKDQQSATGPEAARPRLTGNDGQYVRRHKLRRYAEWCHWTVPINRISQSSLLFLSCLYSLFIAGED